MTLARVFLVLVLVGACSRREGDNSAKPEPPKGAPLPRLADNAPRDRPTTLSSEREAKVAALTAEAKKTYPEAKARYLRGLPPGEHFFVVAPLTSPGVKESVFVAVSAIKDGKVSGTIANQIMTVRGFKLGDSYTFPEDDLVDWLISKADGSEEGNVVGKWLDSRH